MTHVCGACERIKNTPIPLAYSAFIKKFIIFYTMTLPVGYVFSIGYFVVIAVPFILYVLASLELIGESIEEPFGIDQDDLPIDKIAANIRKHCHEIIPA
jgi:putative membrane protein